MGGGAAAGAIIAARRARVQQIIDAFRLGDATAPDRARRFESLGIVATDETRELIVEGILVPGTQEGTYYLSEAGYLYRRQDRRGLVAMVAVALVLLAIGALLLARTVGP